MNFIKAYTTGFKTIFGKGKLWLLLYAINFLFAILLAYPLSGYLEDKLGNTLAADKLLAGFDFTVFNDFMNAYGDLLGLLLNQSLVAIGLYFLLSIFLVGGILNVFKKRAGNYDLMTFWSGCAKYFWRMLRLTIYFFLIQLVIFGLFFVLFTSFASGWPEEIHNEGEIVQRAFLLLPIYILIATIFFMVQDYTKIHIVATDKIILFQPIIQAFKWVFKNFSQTFLLYLLNLLTFGLLFFIYQQINGSSTILLVFLIGQFFLLARIGTKLLNLASATELYQNRN